MSKPGSNASNIDAAAFAERVAYFQAQYTKGIGRNPSEKLRNLVAHVAYCCADSERVRRDPSINDAIKIGIFREQRLAIRQLERAIEARAASEPAYGAYGIAV